MGNISIIKDVNTLESTCYIEVCLGQYKEKHWAKSSLYFEEEIFGLIEPIFSEVVSSFDRYGISEINQEDWAKIILKLEKQNCLLQNISNFEQLLGRVGFLHAGARDYFQTHLEECSTELILLNNELIGWIKSNKDFPIISILGL
jgi:hypothetical protein